MATALEILEKRRKEFYQQKGGNTTTVPTSPAGSKVQIVEQRRAQLLEEKKQKPIAPTTPSQVAKEEVKPAKNIFQQIGDAVGSAVSKLIPKFNQQPQQKNVSTPLSQPSDLRVSPVAGQSASLIPGLPKPKNVFDVSIKDYLIEGVKKTPIFGTTIEGITDIAKGLFADRGQEAIPTLYRDPTKQQYLGPKFLNIPIGTNELTTEKKPGYEVASEGQEFRPGFQPQNLNQTIGYWGPDILFAVLIAKDLTQLAREYPKVAEFEAKVTDTLTRKLDIWKNNLSSNGLTFAQAVEVQAGRGTAEQQALYREAAKKGNLAELIKAQQKSGTDPKMRIYNFLRDAVKSITEFGKTSAETKLLANPARTTVFTPDEALVQANATDLAGTKLSSEITKVANEAASQGKNLQLSWGDKALGTLFSEKTPSGLQVGYQIVEPKKIEVIKEEGNVPPVVKAEIKPVEPTKEISLQTVKQEATKYTSAADFASAVADAKPTDQIGLLPASDIIARDPIDSAQVQRVKDKIAAGQPIEPIEVTKEDGKLITVDGTQRLTAYKELGQDVPAIFRGTEKIAGMQTFEEVYGESATTPLPSPSQEKPLPQAQKEGQPSVGESGGESAINLVEQAIYYGDLEAARQLHSELGVQTNFDEIQKTVETARDAELDSIKKEVGSIESLPEDSPDRVIGEIADKLGKHFNAPGALFKLTGQTRTYETPEGLKLEVGGDKLAAFDKVFLTTDLQGFANNIKVLAYKFDKTFTEINDRITGGDIDDADYERFKERFQSITAKRPTYAQRPSQAPKSGVTRPEQRPVASPVKAVSSGSSAGEASRGPFAELENISKKIADQEIKIIELPEMVRLAEELMGGARPSVTATKRGKYLGLFRPRGGGEILLKAEIFKDSSQAAKTLSHEIGHLMDYLPDQTMTRGNLVGRIASLNKYMKDAFGDLSNKVIKQELMELSAKWRPVSGGAGIADDLKGDKYRSNPKELYADAISVLFNDPARLKQDAPEFWKGFFEYLNKKPAVKENLTAIYDLLNQDPDAIFRARDKAMNESFANAEARFYAKEVEKRKRGSSLLFQIQVLFDNKNQAIINKVQQARKSGFVIEDSRNPMYEVQGLNYLDGKLKNYVVDTFQPVFELAQSVGDGWNTLGKVLQLERTIYERGEMANPGGFDPKTAQDQLSALEKNTSPEDWKVIQQAKEKFRLAVQKTIDEAEKAGYYTPEMISQMKANPAYATYQVVDYIDTNISPRVYKSVGTLKDIANPATSTVMKSISMMKAIERNKVRVDMADFLTEAFNGEIEPAKTSFVGANRPKEFLEPKDPEKGLLITIRDGKPVGYYVDKNITNALNYMSNDTIKMAAQAMRVFTLAPLYRPLFTSLNLGFQTFNFFRDFERYWKNIPDYTLQDALTSFPRAVIRYGQAVPSAIRRVRGKPDALVTAMENSKMLGLKFTDVFKEPVDPEDLQIERVLEKTGVLQKAQKRSIITPIYKVLDGIDLFGNFIESLPKIAGYIELRGKMPEAELANFIRTKIGSPDFRTTGTFTPVSNSVLLFSNAIKEGIKSDFQIATGASEGGRRSQSGFWWKNVVSSVLPTLLIAAAEAGMMGKWLKDRFDDVSEYDKTNYIILPIGINEQGKTIYLRIPKDETGRLIGGLVRKTVKLATKKESGLEDIMQIFSFGAGQFPNVSPSFTGIGAIMEYMSGKNPYDSFRGRNVIPDRDFAAGPAYSLPIFVNWLLQNQGLGVVIPGYIVDNPDKLQKVLGWPLVSNIAGRWLKVSDYGKTEQLKEVTKSVERQQAQRGIEEDKVIKSAVDEYRAGSKNEIRRLQIEKKTFEKIFNSLPSDSRSSQKASSLKKEIRITMIKGDADANLNALIRANSNEQKAELLKSMYNSLTSTEFDQVRSDAIKYGIISLDVINKFRKKRDQE